MNVFNALWDNAEQLKRPPDDNFQLFSTEDWLAMSSTHKILSGSLQCPLPPELEPPYKSASQVGKSTPKNSQNQNSRNNSGQTPQGIVGIRNAQQPKARKVENDKKYVPGLTKFPVFNRMSSLTSEEQKDCLALLLKFEGKQPSDLTLTEKTEYLLFQSLYCRVKEEQKEYLQQAELEWPEYVDRARNLKGDPYNFFIQYWANKVSNAMAQYPKKYRKLKMVTLRSKSMANVELHFNRNLLNIGKVPPVYKFETEQPQRISTSLVKLRARALLTIPPSYLSRTLHNVPVSRDPNAERLARLHGANVVLSTSGLKCLLDNHDERKHPPASGIGKSWTLPVIVKEHRSFCEGKPVTKTIVFIDKPLPLSSMTSYEKVSWYQKHALHTAMIVQHKTGMEFEIKGDDIRLMRESSTQPPSQAPGTTLKSCEGVVEEKRETSPEVPIVSESQISLDCKRGEDAENPMEQSPVEKVGSNVPSTPASTTSNVNISDDDEDSNDENSLTIDLPDDGTVDLNPKPSLKIEKTLPAQTEECAPVKKSIQTVNAETCNTNLQRENIASSIDTEVKNKTVAKPTDTEDLTHVSIKPAESKPTNKWENIPAAPEVKVINGHALPPNFTNVTYNKWSLQSQMENNVTDQTQSNCSGNLNLLIRSHIDGCEALDPGAFQFFSVASKPEFQLEYGPGVIPLSDLTRQWAKLLIQPDSCLVRVRVDVHSAAFVKQEKRILADIEQEAQILYQENLADTLHHLQAVLCELMQLPHGEYLLSHSPEMGSAAQLFRKTNEAETADFNLAANYGHRPLEVISDVPWQPLDPTVVMPKHLHFHCMPCMFQAPEGPKIILKPYKPQKPKPIRANNAQKRKRKKKKIKTKQSVETLPSDDSE